MLFRRMAKDISPKPSLDLNRIAFTLKDEGKTLKVERALIL